MKKRQNNKDRVPQEGKKHPEHSKGWQLERVVSSSCLEMYIESYAKFSLFHKLLIKQSLWSDHFSRIGR